MLGRSSSQALGVPLADNLTGIGTLARGGTSPSLTSTLTVMGNSSTGAARATRAC